MTSINGNSIIVDKMTYVIEDYCSFKNLIIPSCPSIHDNVKIVLPRVVDKDSNSFRIINFSMFKIVLQSRYGSEKDDVCNNFTINSKTMVNVSFPMKLIIFLYVVPKKLRIPWFYKKIFNIYSQLRNK